MPLVSQPFEALSRRMGLDERCLLKRAGELKEMGIVRNIAAHLNHRKLDYKSTLIAFRLSEGRIEGFAKRIIRYPEVTHCYERQGDYNLWTVFIYKNGRLKKILKDIAKDIGDENILELPTKRQFKLKTRIKV